MRFRPGVGVRFGVYAAVCMLALGGLLARQVTASIDHRALRSARQTAVLVERVAIAPLLSSDGLRRGHLTAAQRARLDALVRPQLAAGRVSQVNLYSLDGTVLYSTDRATRGRQERSDLFEQAVSSGQVRSAVGTEESDRDGARQLEVYVPILRHGLTQGIFEIYLPYAPLAAAIHSDLLRMYLTIFGGLAVLYLVLYRIVSLTSKAIRRQAEEKEHQALHDGLTGLANRTLFADRVAHALARGGRTQETVAVLFIDLDDFKNINDSLGHGAGDAVLGTIAERLERILRAHDTVARLGGDEFGVLIDPVGSHDDVVGLTARVQHEMRKPITLHDRTVRVSSSVGIAFGDEVESAEELLRNADLAMYQAKREGRDRHAFFAAEMHSAAMAGLAIRSEIEEALQRGDFVLHYQPIVDVPSGRITSFEALVRWRHPERGLVPPGEFVSVCESSGLIVELGRMVIDMAVRQLAAWRRDLPERGDLMLSVNVSARELLEADFPPFVESTLAHHGVPSSSFGLEITETALMESSPVVLDSLERLRRAGIKVSIDDFGTGYASFGYLARFGVDAIKIDRSFIARVDTGGSEEAIVSAIAKLGDGLRLETVAEGVERHRQLDALAHIGCRFAQGYLLSRPVDADAATALLRNAEHAPLGGLLSA